MFERFTQRARDVVALAQEEVALHGSEMRHQVVLGEEQIKNMLGSNLVGAVNDVLSLLGCLKADIS